MYSTRSDASVAPSPSQSPTHAVVLDMRAPRASLEGLPPGPAGTVATLRIMKRLANEAVRSPTQYARAKAFEIFNSAGLRSRDPREVETLQRWVQNNIIYTKDPVDVELVQTPEVTLKLKRGDCDDQSTLLAAMLKSTGYKVKFVAVGVRGGPFSHVFTEVRLGRGWVAAETILKKPLGWYPPDATSRYALDV